MVETCSICGEEIRIGVKPNRLGWNQKGDKKSDLIVKMTIGKFYKNDMGGYDYDETSNAPSYAHWSCLNK